MPHLLPAQTNRKPGHPIEFVVVFIGIFFLFAILLYAIDFVPESPGTDSNQDNLSQQGSAASSTEVFPLEDPIRVVASSVGIDAPVGNPSSINIDVLDNALSLGAVRYPESGLLGATSRMYLFGHQSYLPVVHNQAYKTFNGLQNLKIGDEIIVYSPTAAYHYRVATVEQVSAETGIVELGGSDRMLTLSTCDSFGAKTDRFIVTAGFIDRVLLTSKSS